MHQASKVILKKENVLEQGFRREVNIVKVFQSIEK